MLKIDFIHYFCNHYYKNKVMTLLIDKKDSQNLKKILLEKLNKTSRKGNLRKHFGKLKRDIDGLEYQLSIRKNED